MLVNSMSNILVFDASSSWCSVALSINGKLYCAAQLQPRKHAQLIMPMIDDLCRQADIKPKQLDGIAFGKGPGSFTGLRIAISVAQGLSLATGAKLFGISSLQALAWQGMKVKNAESIVAIMNAHMGEVFYSAYRKTDQGPVAVIEDALAKPENVDYSQLLNRSDLNSLAWFGAGDGFQFKADMPQVMSFVDTVDEDISSMAESMMGLALSAWDRGEFTAAEYQQPVYLRDTVAWKKLSEQPSLLKR